MLSKTGSNHLSVPPALPTAGLQQIINKCQSGFDFPLDIEWVVNENEVTMVQVRPSTAPVQALARATQSQIKEEQNYLNEVALGDWGLRRKR